MLVKNPPDIPFEIRIHLSDPEILEFGYIYIYIYIFGSAHRSKILEGDANER
jgi:hypothetical protein